MNGWIHCIYCSHFQADSFLKLHNPDLIFAVVAILGNKPSIPGLYHKEIIECLSINIDLEDRPWILTIADYLNAKQIHSFQEFKDSICKFLDLNKSYDLLHGNCLSVEEIFGSVWVCIEHYVN